MVGLVDIGNAIGGPLKELIDKLVPDKAQAALAKEQLDAQLQSGALAQQIAALTAVTSAQTDVDKIEASSTSIFIAGWRPFVGWVCGVGLAVSVVVNPLLQWASALAGHPIVGPKLDDPLLQSTLAGMLGLGYGLRTLEKIKGVAGSH